jgi:hypothetical protein
MKSKILIGGILAFLIRCPHSIAGDADQPDIPYEPLLRECVRRVFIDPQEEFPCLSDSVFEEAVEGMGDPLLPYIREMAEGDTSLQAIHASVGQSIAETSCEATQGELACHQ